MIFPYTNFTTNFQGVNIISFDLTSDLDVKLAILNVKIPDTVYLSFKFFITHILHTKNLH